MGRRRSVASTRRPAVRCRWLAWTLLGSAVSGCVGGDDAADPQAALRPGDASPAGTIVPGTGRILGLVVDDEERPVVDASVTIQHLGLRVHTSLEGKFVLENLRPKNYTLYLNKTGYNDTRARVTARPDEVASPQLRMEKLLPSAPFARTTVTNGYLADRLTVVCSTVDTDPFASDAPRVTQSTKAKLAAVLTALVWSKTPGGTTGPLDLRVSFSGDATATNTTSGDSPLLNRIELERPMAAKPGTVTQSVSLDRCPAHEFKRPVNP